MNKSKNYLLFYGRPVGVIETHAIINNRIYQKEAKSCL